MFHVENLDGYLLLQAAFLHTYIALCIWGEEHRNATMISSASVANESK